MTAILLVLKRAADEAEDPLRGELRQVQEITRGAWTRYAVWYADCGRVCWRIWASSVP